MSNKGPHAAFCEEYDSDTHDIRPETRQVANIAAKRSKTDLRSAAEPLVEAASDSGYSSRTAATANSTQSAPSGRKSPVPLKVDTSLKKFDLNRVRSKGKDRTRGRSAHPAREENKMQVGPYPNTGYPQTHHAQRSPSRPQRRERAQIRHYPGTCWECDQGLYHDATPPEPRQVEYHSYYRPQPPPSSHDYPPPSPQTARYPPSAVVQVSHSSRPQARSTRSNTYHSNNRPLSFHGIMPGMGGMVYNPSPVSSRFEHGPPLSSSAYTNTPTYAPTPPPSHYPQQASYFGFPDAAADPQERSVSRTREAQAPRESTRGRRPSIFQPPVLDYETSSDEEEQLEQAAPQPPPPPPPQPRQRLPSHSSHEHDEDYYRMPPPPLKHKSTPQIIQKKRPHLPHKSATTASITSERRASQSMDLTDIRDALPDYGYQQPLREAVVPERSRSIRGGRRPLTMYHDSNRSARVAVENSRRRRPIVYDDYPVSDDIEDKHRDAVEYQASQAVKPVPLPVPLTADALYKAKASQRAESDSGSQKSRSNSSRGSDARTQNGSGVGSRPEEDNNIVMTMNGVTMSFTQESVGGKKISVRTGDTGALELNIEGKRPKRYITGGSDYSAGRREFEDPRRPRNDRKSDRASRRSSRSTYSGRLY